MVAVGIQCFVEFVNLHFIGYLADNHKIAGVGLAIGIVNVFGNNVCQGFATASVTLCSQAIGAGNYYLAGVHFNTSQLVVILSYLPILLCCLKLDIILVHLGINSETAYYCR